MKFEKKIVALVTIMIMFLIFVASTAKAQSSGLGISPPRLMVDHMVKNVEYKKTFVLSHGEHEEEKYLKIVVDDSIRDWITTEKGMEFEWPHSSQGGDFQFPLTIIAKAPEDAANGTYSGNIRIINTAEPYDENKESGAGSSVSLAVSIEASFTLTDEQVLDYEVHSIESPQAVEEESSFEFIVHIENKGNVKAKPSKVEVDFYDQNNEKLLESQETTDYDEVAAFASDGKTVVSVPQSLELGHYWARIKVFDKEGEMAKEDDVMFEVVPIGSLAKQGSLRSLTNASSIGTGEMLKIVGEFENTGQVNVAAKLVVEVYKGNSLVKVLESTKKSVRVGKAEKFEALFTPEKAGKYKLVGKVEYSGKETSKVESSVLVGGIFGMISPTVMIIIVVLVVIVIAILIRRRKSQV